MASHLAVDHRAHGEEALRRVVDPDRRRRAVDGRDRHRTEVGVLVRRAEDLVPSGAGDGHPREIEATGAIEAAYAAIRALGPLGVCVILGATRGSGDIDFLNLIIGNQSIVGLMLESHLKAGNQPIPKDLSELEYGVSITDPCIDWDTTERLLLKLHEILLTSERVRRPAPRAVGT